MRVQVLRTTYIVASGALYPATRVVMASAVVDHGGATTASMHGSSTSTLVQKTDYTLIHDGT